MQYDYAACISDVKILCTIRWCRRPEFDGDCNFMCQSQKRFKCALISDQYFRFATNFEDNVMQLLPAFAEASNALPTRQDHIVPHRWHLTATAAGVHACLHRLQLQACRCMCTTALDEAVQHSGFKSKAHRRNKT